MHRRCASPRIGLTRPWKKLTPKYYKLHGASSTTKAYSEQKNTPLPPHQIQKSRHAAHTPRWAFSSCQFGPGSSGCWIVSTRLSFQKRSPPRCRPLAAFLPVKTSITYLSAPEKHTAAAKRRSRSCDEPCRCVFSIHKSSHQPTICERRSTHGASVNTQMPCLACTQSHYCVWRRQMATARRADNNNDLTTTTATQQSD